MNLHFIFLNQDNNLRAGWRIAIFLLFQLTLTATIVSLLQVMFRITAEVLTAIAYLILLGNTYIVLRLVDHRPLRSVGLPLHSRFWIEWIQGVLISFLMISAVFVAELALGYVRPTWRGLGADDLLAGFAVMALLFLWFGFGEELLFRGYCFQTLIEGTNRYIAIIIFSTFFGLAHLGNPNVTLFGLVNTVLAGVWLSVAYLKTRTLWFPTALHAGWNFFQGYVYSFPVSGNTFGQRSLFVLEQTGPEWVTGGDYGPEAGVLATVVLLVATVFIVKAPSIQLAGDVWLPAAPVTVTAKSVDSP